MSAATVELRSMVADLRPVPAHLRALDDEYANDPWRWMCEQVQTVDEATQQVRPWPAERGDLKELVRDVLPNESKLFILKSRRMFITWLLSAWMLHKVRYHPANAAYWSAMNEDKAAWVLEHRHRFMEEHLVEVGLRRRPKISLTSGGQTGKMVYGHPEVNSEIKAVAQGPDVFRQYTASMVVSDETEFQRYSAAMLKAALPLVEAGKNVQLIMASTSNGPSGPIARHARACGFVKWDEIYRPPRSSPVTVPLLRHKTGAVVVLEHYSMDEAKDREWMAREREQYDNVDDWEQEMEMDTMTVAGNRVYKRYVEAANGKPGMRYDPSRPLLMGWDFNVDPMTWVLAQHYPPDLRVIDESFLEPGSVETAFNRFLDHYGEHPGQVIVYGGHDGHNRQQGGQGRSHYKQMEFMSLGRPFELVVRVPASAPPVRDSVTSVNMLLRDPDGVAHLYIDTDRCPELVADLLEVIWDPKSEQPRIMKSTDPSDAYYRRTHISDALRYLVHRRCPFRKAVRKKAEDETRRGPKTKKRKKRGKRKLIGGNL